MCVRVCHACLHSVLGTHPPHTPPPTRPLQKGGLDWNVDAVFFTEADQVVYCKNIHGVLSSLGSQVVVAPNRLNQEWCGLGQNSGTGFLDNSSVCDHRPRSKLGLLERNNGVVRVGNRTLATAPFNSCNGAELIYSRYQKQIQADYDPELARCTTAW